MKKITITSSVENGNLKRNRKLIKDAISTFENKTVSITIQKFRKSRSNNQNAYFWGVVVPLVQQGLIDATAEVRDAQSIYQQILLPMFAPTRDITNRDTGEVISERMTSSELSTVEFMEFIQEIQKWAAEFLGITIPDPNEKLEIQFD